MTLYRQGHGFVQPLSAKNPHSVLHFSPQRYSREKMQVEDGIGCFSPWFDSRFNVGESAQERALVGQLYRVWSTISEASIVMSKTADLACSIRYYESGL